MQDLPPCPSIADIKKEYKFIKSNSNVLTWFNSLSLEEKIKTISIYNSNLSFWVNKMYQQTIQSSSNQFLLKFNNNYPQIKYIEAFDVIYNANAVHNEYDDALLNEIRFVSIREKNDTLTLSHTLLSDKDTLQKYFMFFSQGKAFTQQQQDDYYINVNEIVTTSTTNNNTSNAHIQGYSVFNFPEWFNAMKCASLGEIVIAYMEMEINIKYFFSKHKGMKYKGGKYDEIVNLNNDYDDLFRKINVINRNIIKHDIDIANNIQLSDVVKDATEKYKIIFQNRIKKQNLERFCLAGYGVNTGEFYVTNSVSCSFDCDRLINEYYNKLIYHYNVECFVYELAFATFDKINDRKLEMLIEESLFAKLVSYYEDMECKELIHEFESESVAKKKGKKKKKKKHKKHNNEDVSGGGVNNEGDKCVNNNNNSHTINNNSNVININSTSDNENDSININVNVNQPLITTVNTQSNIEHNKDAPLSTGETAIETTTQNEIIETETDIQFIQSIPSTSTITETPKEYNIITTDSTQQIPKDTNTTPPSSETEPPLSDTDNPNQNSPSPPSKTPLPPSLNTNYITALIKNFPNIPTSLISTLTMPIKEIKTLRQLYFNSFNFKPISKINKILPPSKLTHKLHNTILTKTTKLLSHLSQTKQTKFCCLLFLINHLHKHFANNSFQIQIYGSNSTGLLTAQSDIDISINIDNTTKTNSMLIWELYLYLKLLNICSTLTPLTTASVPILKIELHSNKVIPEIDNEIIHFDITFNIHNVKASIDYTRSKLKKHFQIKPLFIIIKHLLIKHKLSKTYEGGISSHVLFLMLTAFINGIIKYEDKPTNNDLGEHLMKFLLFYGKQFQYCNTTIDVTKTHPFILNTTYSSVPICVDPITKANASKGAYNYMKVKQLFQQTYSYLISLQDNTNEKVSDVVLKVFGI